LDLEQKIQKKKDGGRVWLGLGRFLLVGDVDNNNYHCQYQ
jgi:hypothetical protein